MKNNRENHDAEPALRVSAVHFTFPARRRRPANHAVRGVDLTVEPGQSVALLGPNGSGKSTLMKIICGLLPVESGHIRICGKSSVMEMRQLMGVVFQREALDPHVSVEENLRDQAALYGLRAAPATEAIDRGLAAADLLDVRSALVKTLSGGMRRRADLCRALLHEPKVLILDEPTTGLDPGARVAFLNQLAAQRSESGLSILMITHLVDEADRQDRVALMHEGRIVADDAPAVLRQELGERRLAILDPAWQPPADDDAWRRTATGWALPLGEATATNSAVVTKLADAGLCFSIAPPTLADVFELRTGARLDDEEESTAPITGRAAR